MIGAAADARSCLSGCWKYWMVLRCLRELSPGLPGLADGRLPAGICDQLAERGDELGYDW